ncbi:MAG TPA: peptidylprolyl isomerase, partial [Gaiellaceae bacterium]
MRSTRIAAATGGIVLLAIMLAGCGSKKPASMTALTGPKKNGCVVIGSEPAMGDRNEKKPTAQLDAGKHYDVTMNTNCGSFTFRLDQAQSPNAAASIVSLVKEKFFDNTVFHRIVPGFVIQGGDPTGTGNGGPGYMTVDTPPKTAAYTHGVVAMAKTQVDPKGTAGSQFFVVTSADAGLTPDYAIVGTVTKGLDVVDRIGKL